MNDIWAISHDPESPGSDEPWPCIHIPEVASSLIPLVSRGSKIPPSFVELFSRDIPTLPTHLKRVDHISAFIGIEEVHDYPKYCQVVISDCWWHSVECAVHAYLVQNAKL